MFRYAKSGSLLFQALCWLFVGSLFCDSANLDDLFRGVTILHGDVEVLAGTLLPAVFPDEPGAAGKAPTAVITHASPGLEKAPLLVVDQDSPSLPGGTGERLAALALPSRCREAMFPPPAHASSALHILLRHLLI